MRKVNLILIAIFTLIFAGNAFGQWHHEIDKVRGKTKPKTTAKSKVKKTKGYQSLPELDANANRRKNQTANSSKIKAKKPLKMKFEISGGTGDADMRQKQPRKRKTTKLSKNEVSIETIERKNNLEKEKIK